MRGPAFSRGGVLNWGSAGADGNRMRIRSLLAAALIAVAACGGGGDPTVPAGQDDGGSGLITENVERARDVADQVNQRESELEQIVEDMGG